MISKFLIDFDVKEKLGNGAFSVVKRCIKNSTGEAFAVKILNTKRMNFRERARLDVEVRICRLLKHPNIIQFFDVFYEIDCCYMIFELLTGGELFEEITLRQKYTEQDASVLMQKILEAVNYCHLHNIIHRDIKPENLLMANKNPDSDVKLADFGLAVEFTEGEKEYFGFAGTTGYLAPEVAKKIPYGKEVDVWSCGVILYILVSGYPPFWDDDNSTLLSQIIHQPLIFHQAEWKDTSNEVKNLISRMLEKNTLFRISITDALNDPWIKNRDDVALKLNRQDTLIVLKKFNARRKLKGAIISTMITNKFTKAMQAANKETCKQIPSVVVNDNENGFLKNQSPVNAETEDKIEMAIQNEIIQITDLFLHSCISLDYIKLKELCAPNITIFDSAIKGVQMTGLNMIKFCCDYLSKRPASIVMMYPNVILLGTEAACISFVKVTQYTSEKTTESIVNQTEETLIWHKKENNWCLVHMHRTYDSTNSQSKPFYL